MPFRHFRHTLSSTLQEVWNLCYNWGAYGQSNSRTHQEEAMTRLSEQELRRLIQGGETNTVELKAAAPRPVEMAERMCGLANAQEGMIIIGVEDSQHTIVGVPDDRVAITIDTILRAARQNVKPALVLDPPEPELYEVDGKRLVVAAVSVSRGPVYQSGGVFWVRRGTHTVPLDASELLELLGDKGLVDWEHQPVRGSTMEDLDMGKVEAYLKQRSTRERQPGRFEHMEQIVVGMGCAVELDGGDVVPTNAGLLFFGYDPQFFIIQGEVVCVLFRETIGASRYADRKIVTGTLQDLIDGAEAFLNRYMAVGARVEGWKRIDIPEYSLEALREAIINAVVHRDYSKWGESIRVFYYPDRVEVHSPGLLLPGITVEQMERGEVQSKLRNPILAGLLRDIPGYMERIGSGIRFMLDETKRMGLPTPQFRETGEFIVTFHKAPALMPASVQPQERATLWEDDGAVQPEVPGQNMPDERESRLIKAVNCVHEHGVITNKAYRGLTGASDRTAHRDLELLVDVGGLKVLVSERRGATC
jgi:predicted HTH transcriptional regulator